MAAFTCFTERPLDWCSSWRCCLRCCCSSSKYLFTLKSGAWLQRETSAFSLCAFCVLRPSAFPPLVACRHWWEVRTCRRPRVDIAEIITWSNCSCRASHVEMTQFTIFLRYQFWCLFSLWFDSVRAGFHCLREPGYEFDDVDVPLIHASVFKDSFGGTLCKALAAFVRTNRSSLAGDGQAPGTNKRSGAFFLACLIVLCGAAPFSFIIGSSRGRFLLLSCSTLFLHSHICTPRKDRVGDLTQSSQ